MRLRTLAVQSSLVVAAVLVGAVGSTALGSASADPRQAGPIYEIRNYHFNPDLFDEYARSRAAST